MDPNHKMLAAAAVLLIVMGIIFYFQKKHPELGVLTPVAVVATPQPPKSGSISLLPQNSSGISGTAILKELDGKAVVSLDLTGVASGINPPAHIHVGTCPNPGLVKYPLINPVNGKSDTTLDVSLAQLKSELPLAINIHKSPDEPKIYVSCGNLTF